MSIETRALEKIQLCLQHRLSADFLNGGNIEVIANHLSQDYIARIQVLIWSEKITTIAYPKDWWEAFRSRWFPKWVLSRWPVEYVKFDVRAIYPEYRAAPGLGPNMIKVFPGT